MSKRQQREDLAKDLLNSPVVDIHKAITVGHIWKVAKYFYPQKTMYKKLLGSIDKQWLVNRLDDTMKWIINDRISSGIGKGGWAKSEAAWMAHAFGEEAGKKTNESILTTVVAMEALHRHNALMKKMKRKVAFYQWNKIVDELLPFLIGKKRYSEESGKAGKLGSIGSDGEWKPNYDYRHTALILRLWSLSSRWNDYFDLTKNILLSSFDDKDFVDWRGERTVTLVMAHNAFRLIQEKSVANDQDLLSKIGIVGGKIVNSFDTELVGWPAKSVDRQFTNEMRLRTRNYYTLLTLAMIPQEWRGENEELSEQMDMSLKHTLEHYVCNDDSENISYIRRPDDNKPDFSATMIAFSAIARKVKLTDDEEKILKNITKYVLSRYEKDDFNYNDPYDQPYCWSAAHFVMDLCEVLLDDC